MIKGARIKIISCVASLLGMSNVIAQQSPWVLDKPGVTPDTITITPSVCALEETGQTCEMEITIDYNGITPRNLCLFLSSRADALWCEKDVSRKQTVVQVNLSDNLNVSAIDTDSGKQLASAELTLTVYQPVKKRKRRHYGLGIL